MRRRRPGASPADARCSAPGGATALGTCASDCSGQPLLSCDLWRGARAGVLASGVAGRRAASLRSVTAMLALLALLVLVGSFFGTFALMRGIQRLPAQAVQPVSGLPRPARRIAVPVGPDDDLAFLRELRRRIDQGHFGS